MGWWRRNRWGLVAVVPALIALLAISAEHLDHQWYRVQPRHPLTAAVDGSYAMLGTVVQLVELAPASDLKTYDGQPFQPPGGAVIWRVRIAFTIFVPRSAANDPMNALPGPTLPPRDPSLPPESQLAGCDLILEAVDGRTFADDPHDLLDGAADALSSGCLVDFDAPDPMHYTSTSYFALPRDAQPAAVQLVISTALPDYIRLTPTSRPGG